MKKIILIFMGLLFCVHLAYGQSNKAVLVEVSGEALGKWPWRQRRNLAKIIDALSVQGAKAIVVTLPVYDWTSYGADQALLKSVKAAGNVYFAQPAWNPLYQYAKGIGNINEYFNLKAMKKSSLRSWEAIVERPADLGARNKVYFIGPMPALWRKSAYPYSIPILFILIPASVLLILIVVLKNKGRVVYFKKRDISIKMPLRKGNFSFGIYYQLSHNSAGGLFDFIDHENGRCSILMGDVPGTGERTYNYFKKIIQTYFRMPDDFGPREIMVRLNNMLLEERPGMFANLMLLDLESDKRHIRFSNSGFEPLILFRRQKKEFKFFKDEFSLPLGIKRDITFNEKDLHLDKADILILANSGMKAQFNLEQLKYAVTKNCYLSAGILARQAFKSIVRSKYSDINDDKVLLVIGVN